MKTLKTFLIVTFISCITFSCSSDDDSTIIASDLIGTWLLTASDGEAIPSDACDITAVITSTTITSTEFYGENCDMSDSFTPVTYTINGNIISIVNNQSDDITTITTLNSTTLTIRSTGTDDGEAYVDIETYTRQ